MLYVSSALGFYFPYDFCLYSDMTAVVSYVLKFIPAILAIFVLPVVVVLRFGVKYLSSFVRCNVEFLSSIETISIVLVLFMGCGLLCSYCIHPLSMPLSVYSTVHLFRFKWTIPVQIMNL